MIIFYILTTLSLDNVWTLLGENCCWSLLGPKGLTCFAAVLVLQNKLHVFVAHFTIGLWITLSLHIQNDLIIIIIIIIIIIKHL